MGIRINSALVYGVKFTNKECRAFEKFLSDKPQDWFLMRFIEKDLADSWSEYGKKKLHYYDIYFTMDFLARSKKGKALHPYRPFWYNYSKKNLRLVESDLYDAAAEYLSSHGATSESRGFERRFIWFPFLHHDCQPTNIFGRVVEHNYARETDYALVDLLDFREKSKIITIKGQYPWELGTTADREKKGHWHTFNGQNMVPEIAYPVSEKEHVLNTILYHKGTRKDFIARKKEIWDKYHDYLRPYKTYYGDGWHGTSYHFYEVDMLFKFISEHIPEIRYDIMRLEKLLCYYWS